MGDVADRDEKEAMLARVLGLEFNKARIKLMALIPALEAFVREVSPEFWNEHSTALRSGIAPLLAKFFLDQAEDMLDDYAFLGVDWGLVNTAAADWARKYTFDLVKGITDTSRATLQKLIPQFFENQWTQGQLREALSPLFGVVRAEMIARTEVTRAAAQGEEETARLLAEQGIQMIPVWNTREDEIVCPICGKDGLSQRKADGVNGEGRPYWTLDGVEYTMPAHPRCRCWETHELPEVD